MVSTSVNVNAVNRNRETIAFMLYISAFFFSTLFDLYRVGVGRVFDFAALLLLLPALLMLHKQTRAKVNTWQVAFFLFWIFAILRADTTKDVLAGFFGVTVFYSSYYTFSAFRKYRLLECSLIAISAFHVFIFFSQLLAFDFFKYVIDFSGMFGSIASRIFNPDINFFRASGLFQEPNSFSQCTFFLILCLFRFSSKMSRVLRYILCACMLFSNSLWGMAAVLGYLLLFLFHKEFLKVAVFCLVVVCFSPFWLQNTTIKRIMNVADEPSFHVRYNAVDIGTVNNNFAKFDDASVNIASENQSTTESSFHVRYNAADSGTINNNVANTWAMDLIFGKGFASLKYMSYMGVNGVSDLLYSIGFLGFLLLIIMIYHHDAHPIKANLICILLFITSYPMFTYAYFWMVLAMIFLLPAPRFWQDSILSWRYKGNQATV